MVSGSKLDASRNSLWISKLSWHILQSHFRQHLFLSSFSFNFLNVIEVWSVDDVWLIPTQLSIFFSDLLLWDSSSFLSFGCIFIPPFHKFANYRLTNSFGFRLSLNMKFYSVLISNLCLRRVSYTVPNTFGSVYRFYWSPLSCRWVVDSIVDLRLALLSHKKQVNFRVCPLLMRSSH
jgi:hypothetical protein